MQVSSAGLSEAEGPDSYFARLEIFFTAIFASELALNVLAHFFWPFFMVRTPASQPAASPFRHCIAQKAGPWPRRHARLAPTHKMPTPRESDPQNHFARIQTRGANRSPLAALRSDLRSALEPLPSSRAIGSRCGPRSASPVGTPPPIPDRSFRLRAREPALSARAPIAPGAERLEPLRPRRGDGPCPSLRVCACV